MLAIGRTRAALLVLCTLPACGREGPDFTIEQTLVEVRSDAAFAHQPDFPARITRTAAAALDYWGGTWRDLEGVTLVFEGSQFVACGGLEGAIGCFDGDIRVSTRDPAFVFSCVEQTSLVHEIGHAVLGDPDHQDPRWLDFGSVERALAGGRGYLPGGGQGPCPLFPSVWRHPHGGPHG
jgi:hypothetical protein